MTAFSESTVHKIVPLRFAGVDLKLKTSHALFSHHHVDDGTMLLLKTLAQQAAVPAAGRVLDAGCGYGPLALALKKSKPELTVVARDRLALAAAFTRENARVNKVDVDAAPGLLLEDVPGPWNLIVSNLPAKAGEPVLADFVRRSLGLLAPEGLVAVVIVETLAPWFATQLTEAAASLVYEEAAQGYRVFHYRNSAAAVPLTQAAFPVAYHRGEVRWSVGPRALVEQTCFGLPNFDALDYRTQVTVPLLERVALKGECLVWEPVQGHLATWADAQLGPEAALHLAGNDALALAASSRNVARRTPVVHAVPSLSALDLGTGSLGSALVQFHPEPEVPWVEEARDSLLRLLAPGAVAVVNGTSTELTRFLEHHKGLRKLRDERTKGWRAVVLERQTLS